MVLADNILVGVWETEMDAPLRRTSLSARGLIAPHQVEGSMGRCSRNELIGMGSYAEGGRKRERDPNAGDSRLPMRGVVPARWEDVGERRGNESDCPRSVLRPPSPSAQSAFDVRPLVLLSGCANPTLAAAAAAAKGTRTSAYTYGAARSVGACVGTGGGCARAAVDA